MKGEIVAVSEVCAIKQGCKNGADCIMSDAFLRISTAKTSKALLFFFSIKRANKRIVNLFLSIEQYSSKKTVKLQKNSNNPSKPILSTIKNLW